MRKRVLWLWDCRVHPRPWSNPRSFIAAPTRDQVKSIYWADVKALTPKPWIADINETSLSIRTRWGAELRLVGLNEPARIEGSPWDCGCIDEYADCKAGVFDAHIRPAIADRSGGIDLLGVPDFSGPAQGEYQEFCERGQSRLDPEWADFSWGSDGILPATEIASMRRTMDPRLFDQETTGRFLLPGGRAFPDYDESIHVDDGRAEYDPALPLCWSLDFNVDPMCSGVVQFTPSGEIHVVDEIVIPDTITRMAAAAFLDRAKSRGWNLGAGIRVYGDPAGNQRRSSAGVSGETDWIIVRNELSSAGVSPAIKVSRAPWPISDTRNAVNAKLMNAEGKSSLFIHSRCRQLRKDMKSLVWPSDLSEGHCAAWLRYFMIWEFPVRSMAVSPSMQIGVL